MEGDNTSMQIRFYGNATVSLHHQGVCLLIDPWFAGEPWFRPNPFTPQYPEELRPDLILLTHGHGDHLGEGIELSVRLNVPILAPRELALYCMGRGAQASGGQPGGSYRYEWGSVKMTPAIHASSVGPRYEYAGLAIGFVVRLGGKVVYHAGDTALFGDMRLIGDAGPIDVAFLPVGDYFTMGPEDGCTAVKLLKPRTAVPIHHSAFPQMTGDPYRFKELVENETETRCMVVQPGDTLEVK